MKRLPTDYQILKKIFNDYIDDYLLFQEDASIRRTNNYVPIDLDKIAKALKTESNLLFGRLYYDLEGRYGKKIEENVYEHFFALRLGNENHCIHFPYLAGILASMKWENRKFWLATMLSGLAILISVIALLD